MVRKENSSAHAAGSTARSPDHGAGDMDVVGQAENVFGHVEHAAGDVSAAAGGSRTVSMCSGRWRFHRASGMR